jgi:hypothetical protein
VGFHAHASDIEIAFELVDLIDHIEMFIAALFVKDPFAEHKHAHIVAFVHSDIRQPYCVVDGLPIGGGDYKENLHRDTLLSERKDQIADSANVSLSADWIPSWFHDPSLFSGELYPSQMVARLQSIALPVALPEPSLFDGKHRGALFWFRLAAQYMKTGP